MPQLFPNPVSSTQNLTINTSYPLIGGGSVALGGNLTLAVSSTQNSNRLQYSVTPAPDGTIANFNIVNTSSSLSIPYADVYVNGQIQLTSNYSLTGNVLSFNTAPAAAAKIYAVFAQPADERNMYTLTPATDGVTTIFSFPSTQPFGSYVDIYVGQIMKTVGVDYYLDINNGVYTINFLSAPASGASLVAVFDASVNSGRSQYTVTPAANGAVTTFQIIGGAPSSPYIDLFAGGLFQAEGIDYSFQFVSGNWTVTFTVAPATSTVIVPIFAPTTILPSASGTTSVGLALPSSVFTVSGSPVTSIGTLTGSFNTQSTHTVFAGPTSGTAVPTFRVLSTADLSNAANIALVNISNTFLSPQMFSNETGTGNTLAIGQITTASPKQLVITNTPASNVLTLQGVQQGIAFNQDISLQPSGGNVILRVSPVITAGVTATSATAGAATALPATPQGYLSISINGTTVKIPYFSV